MNQQLQENGWLRELAQRAQSEQSNDALARRASGPLPAVSTPCSHNVPLQREPLGDHSANFCPTCRAVEAERERCLRIAAAAVEHLLMNSELGFSGTLDEMLSAIRSGE